ncbi:hypothetical protein RBH29_16420 [Herbivorax sp. ANBcel31]|nr:hypothetical protein [Herbivorax sp. ANBcel31]MDQ2088015.1 hypothetical protein [Herbivorax sp. ANBcel31]
MNNQVLVDVILERLPAQISGITFIFSSPSGSVSKNKYYVN